MRVHELNCHCKVVTDHRGNDRLPPENMCAAHRQEYDTFHAAAIESCSLTHRAAREVAP
jgi:hypothetical protein